MVMDELAKANHSVMKLGGDAIAREATIKQLEEDLAKWKEWANKASERVSDLEKAGNKQKTHIAKLNKEIDGRAKELEASLTKIDSLKA